MYFYALLFLLGLVFGSFITMASYRLGFDKPKSLVGRSKCPKCNHILGISALIPLFSYLFQLGKCKYCRAPISARYPLTEFITASFFIYTAYILEDDLINIALLNAYVVMMMILIVTDFEKYIIPDEVQIGVAVIGIFYAFFNGYALVNVLLMPAVMLGISLALKYGFIFYKKKDGLGWGDVKFFAASGLFLTPELISPYFLFSGVTGIFTALIWRFLGLGKVFPFGPAISLALYFVLLFPESASWAEVLLGDTGPK